MTGAHEDCEGEVRLRVYEQHYEAFRDLNRQLWQVPILAMTLTGGLWFGAAESRVEPVVSMGLFFLAFVGNVVFFMGVHRIRYIQACILEKLRDMYPVFYVDAASRETIWARPKMMVRGWSIVLCAAALFSLFLGLRAMWSVVCAQ